MNQNSQSEFCLIITTTDKSTIAQQIATTLLQKRLSACVQVLPCQSHYVWKEKLEQAEEYRVEIKTKTSHFKAITSILLSLHNYETPEIIQIPITNTSKAYARWLQESMD